MGLPSCTVLSLTVDIAPDALLSVEGDLSANLPPVEREIVDRLHAAGSRAQSEHFRNPEWTSHFKDVLTELGQKHGFFVTHSGYGGEWLFDVVWVETRGPDGAASDDWRDAVRLKLACEIEWKPTNQSVLRDFLKLTFSAAELRLFVYTNRVVTHEDGKVHPIELCRTVAPPSRGFRYLAMGFPYDESYSEVRIDAWEE